MVTYDQFNKFNRIQLPFDWATISAPVNENRRAQSDELFIDGFYVIPATSTKKEAAWALLKFFNSETVARWEMQGVYGFPSIQSVLYVESNEKRNIRAFTSFEPIPSTEGMPSGLVELGGQFYSEVLPDLSNLSAVLDKLQSGAEKHIRNSKKRKIGTILLAFTIFVCVSATTAFAAVDPNVTIGAYIGYAQGKDDRQEKHMHGQ